MATIKIRYGLPFVEAVVIVNGKEVMLENVLLDTGCGVTIFRSTDFIDLGVSLDKTDMIQFISGIGGREAVIPKPVDGIRVGELSVNRIEVQLGAMNYGFPMDGIIGMDFLLATGAVINLHTLSLERAS